MKLDFDAKIGPAFIAVVVQTLGAVIAATMMYASVVNTADNTKRTADKLQEIVEKQDHRQNVMGERLTTVETSVKMISSSVDRIDSKLDFFRRTQAP